jgi:prophage tail gpP-like protein
MHRARTDSCREAQSAESGTLAAHPRVVDFPCYATPATASAETTSFAADEEVHVFSDSFGCRVFGRDRLPDIARAAAVWKTSDRHGRVVKVTADNLQEAEKTAEVYCSSLPLDEDIRWVTCSRSMQLHRWR